MELKINYQYTYFIHPFIIEENKYKEYIIKMLKDKNIRLKIFEKEAEDALDKILSQYDRGQRVIKL